MGGLVWCLNLSTPKGVFIEFRILRMRQRGKLVLVLDGQVYASSAIWSSDQGQKLEQFQEELSRVERLGADTPISLAALKSAAWEKAMELSDRRLRGVWHEGENGMVNRRKRFAVL